MADILTSEFQLSSGGDVLKLAPKWDNIQDNKIQKLTSNYGIKVTKPKTSYWYDGYSFKIVDSYSSVPTTWHIAFRWSGNVQMDGTDTKGARYVQTAYQNHPSARSLRVFVSEDTTNYYCYFIWMSAATDGSATTLGYDLICDDQLNPSSFTVLSTAPTIADLTEVPWYKAKRTLVNGSVDASDITSGTLPIARGGTGATTQQAAQYNIIKPQASTVNLESTRRFAFISEAPSSTSQLVYYRTASTVWDWVKSNLSGTDVNIGGNAATASAAQSGSSLETSINGKVTSNSAITGDTKCKITYDSKGLVTAGTDITSEDIAPIYTKTFENVLATAADTNNANFYFGKITPDGNSIYKQWRIRYRLYADLHDPTAIPSTDTDKGNNVYVKGWFDVEINARGEGVTTFKIWNNHSSTNYRSVTYHLVGRAKNAYITSAGYHLLGIRTRDAYKPISTGWGRDYRVEILEMKGCTFEFYDTIQKHSAVYTSNYVGLSEFDGVNNGLRETGDDNSYDTICNANTAFVVGTGGLKQYSICAIDSTGKIQSFTTTSGVGTSKTVNTAKFRFPLTLFRYNQGTDRASGYYFKEWNWMDTQRSNLDSRYSCNRGSVFNGNSGPVYIEGEVGADGLFTVSNNILTQTFVAGKVYVHIGNTYNASSASANTYVIEFSTQHPCFYYDGTNLIPYEHSLYLEPSDTVLTVDCIDITL